MTYSVVARCPVTGKFGVAVATHNLAVGWQVPSVEAGVGAIATQSWSLLELGPRGLELLRSGASATTVMNALLPDGELNTGDQLAIVDAFGAVAVRTGSKCVPFASHSTADGASFQANLMKNVGVSEAMADSWSRSVELPFEQRLLIALQAAQYAGGDIRGEQARP